jgi:hypothetical protein
VRKGELYSILTEIGMHMKAVRIIKLCLKETYNEVHIGKYMSDGFPIQNGLKQGDALSPLLLNSVFYVIRNVQEGMELNGTHQFLVYAVLLICRVKI